MIKFIFYLIYRYYSKEGSKSRDIAYISAVGLFLVIVLITVADISLILNLKIEKHLTLPDDKLKKYMYVILGYLFPGYLMCYFFLKEDKLKALSYNEDKIKRGKILLISYLVLIVSICVVMSFYRNGK